MFTKSAASVLAGQPFQRSCGPLKLNVARDSTGRLAWWALILQRCNLIIQYNPGRDLGNVDTLLQHICLYHFSITYIPTNVNR